MTVWHQPSVHLDRRPGRSRRTVWAAVLLAAGMGLTACGGGASTADVATVSPTGNGSGFRGDTLPQPVTLSSADAGDTFTSSAGGTTTLGRLQQGHVMVVYYGYTHCPDVCPTTMADLGVALRKASPAVQRRVQVVFITSDPQRDSAPVMSAWLAHFDYGLPVPFVGLTASLDQIDAVATTMGVPLSPPVVAADGTVTVTHGAQSLPFVDGQARLVWLASTEPDDYLHDLDQLVAAS